MKIKQHDLTYVDMFMTGTWFSACYYVVLLNYSWPVWWQSAVAGARRVILADGAANRLLSVISGDTMNVYEQENTQQAEQLCTQERIVGLLSASVESVSPTCAAGDTKCNNKFLSAGDYDSLYPDTQVFLAQYGIAMNRDDDQNTTDGDKALELLLDMLKGDSGSFGGESSLPLVLILGAFGGRLDHTLGHFNLLHRYSHRCVIHLHGDGNTALLIPPSDLDEKGKPQYIIVNLPEAVQIDAVGVIAHNGPCRVWSRGLRWDMDALLLGYETLQSNCNLPAEKEVGICAQGHVLFTMHIMV